MSYDWISYFFKILFYFFNFYNFKKKCYSIFDFCLTLIFIIIIYIWSNKKY